jgi:hypothetical protein
MRKLIVAVIAVLYFGVSSGAVVTIHQCMGKLSSVSFSAKEKSCKCSAKSKKKMPCCKSDSQLVKLNAEHQSSSTGFDFLNTAVATLQEYNTFVIPEEVVEKEIRNYTTHSPPLIQSRLYIQNSVFRI